MGRGVSSGGGQSSLGYLFGGGEAPKPTANTSEAPKVQAEVAKPTVAAPSATAPSATAPSAAAPSASPPSADAGKQIPAGVPGNKANNYFRADGQNCGNFLTDRPTTKVHAAPGGGSSLNYLFGGDGK